MEFVGISEILLQARFSLATKNVVKLDRNSNVSIFLDFSPGNTYSYVTVKELNPEQGKVAEFKGKAKGNRYFVCGALIGLALKILKLTSTDLRELPAYQNREAMLPPNLPFCLFASFARGFASALQNLRMNQIFSSANHIGIKTGNVIFTITASETVVMVNGNGTSKDILVPSSIHFSQVRFGTNIVYVWKKTGIERIDRLLASTSLALAQACLYQQKENFGQKETQT